MEVVPSHTLRTAQRFKLVLQRRSHHVASLPFSSSCVPDQMLQFDIGERWARTRRSVADKQRLHPNGAQVFDKMRELRCE
jgi:hypothetical protein